MFLASLAVQFIAPLHTAAAGEIEIDTCEELQAIEDDLDASYILTTDIDCSETATWNGDPDTAETYFGFIPIGQEGDFTGTLDGDGYKITGLYINQPGSSDVGLISEIDGGGVVRNIGLEDVNVTGGYNVGALVGEQNGGRIENAYSTGTVTGSDSAEAVGGLVGEMDDDAILIDSYSEAEVIAEGGALIGGLVGYMYRDSIIKDSYATGTVSGNSEVGGLVGYTEGTIYGTYATGAVSATDKLAGGLVGLNEGGSIAESHATGDVTGDIDTGGLVGVNYGVIVNSHAEGSVTATGSMTGGLTGRSAGSAIIKQSYATGDVTSTGSRVGGLTGANGGEIKDAYASGSVEGGDQVGGLAGRSGGKIINSYAVGEVSSEEDAGGLVGRSDGGDVYASFWDTETTLQETSDGEGNSGEGKTTAEMKSLSTFTDAGWDFANVWQLLGGSYPSLRQVALFTSGEGLEDEPFEVSSCKELQNVAYLARLNFVQTSDIDCVGAATWNSQSRTGWYLGTGDGSTIEFSIEVPKIAFGSVTAYLNSEEDLGDYAVGYGDDATYIYLVEAPDMFDIYADFSYYEGFIPIGEYVDFSGTYDGADNSISNLYINQYDNGDVGLFSEVEGGSIENVVLEDVEIRGGYNVGALVGESFEGNIYNSHSSGQVIAYDYESSNTGGLVGESEFGSVITNSSSSATVIGYRDVGGLVGENGSTITGSHASGAVTGEGGVGGFVGRMPEGSISKSYATGAVTTADEGGGFAGYANGKISKSYATGAVEGNAYIGGFVGYNEADITDAYARGNVTGFENVGGFVGENWNDIKNSYSTGAVSGEASVGGFSGAGDVPATNSFWDVQTSGQDESNSGEGKTTAQMKTLATFTSAEWDFDHTWAIDAGTNDGYPYFNFRHLEGNVLVVLSYWGEESEGEGGDPQDHEYIERAGFAGFTTATTEEFANATPDFYDDYDIVIYEPDSNYDDLRAGLPALAEAMEEKPMVASIRVAGNEGDQDNIDFLGTDYERILHEDELFADPDHPMLTGEGIYGVELTTEDFEYWDSTDHGILYNLPEEQPGFNVILENEDGASWIEYKYGQSHVLVDTLTSIDGDWGYGNSNVADNYAKYLSYRLGNPADDIKDSDGDGRSDDEEDKGPNGGDANNDGVPDSEQASVSSFVNDVTGKYAVVAVDPSCSITSASAQAESTNTTKDSGFDYKSGFVNFVATCGTPGYTMTVNIYQYGVNEDGLIVRKYYPDTGAYFTIPDAGPIMTTIDGQAVAIAAYDITDGGELDIDGTPNGTIVDPVGLGASTVGAPNTGLGRNEE